MASNSQAVPFAEVVPLSRTRTFRWSRAIPLALVVPIVLAFGTPAFAFALLATVLAAPVAMAVVAVMVARAERSA
ncbi:MAG TPA: hypothetical protein VLT61_04745 [Anaeromyxobacteraceae bacterium]|nr:hypothetical protein [Anaeromyxobacteraceae bacterium]